MSRQDCPYWHKDRVRGISYCSRGLDKTDGHSVLVIEEGTCERCNIYKEIEFKYGGDKETA